MQKSDSDNINVTLKETRKFEPSSEFSKNAKVKKADYPELVQFAHDHHEKYWEAAARELKWHTPWKKVLEWDAPEAKWFVDGRINASVNCLDRHLDENATKTALIWEGEPGEISKWSYAQLHSQVERFTAALRRMGLRSGDRVDLYADDS